MEKKIVELMNTELDLYENVPYRWFVFDDYSETESNVLVLFNHAFADGVSFLGIYAFMDSNKDFNKFPPIKGLSFT